jgi:hypothetical protein
MPIPLSEIVIVRAALSKLTLTFQLIIISYKAALIASKRNLSDASDAFEISSRKFLLEYKDGIINDAITV